MMPSRTRVRQLTKAENILLQRAVQKVARWHKETSEALALSMSNMQSEGGPVGPEGAGDPIEIMKAEAEHYSRVACFLAGKRLGQRETTLQSPVVGRTIGCRRS